MITGSGRPVGRQDPERELIERALGRPVAGAAWAAWGFTKRTDMVTLVNGRQVAVQRYRRRKDAANRLRVMQGLSGPATEAGIPLPRVREFSLEDDTPWVIYDVLPGGTRFTHMARLIGELLAAFRRLPAASLGLDDLRADPQRLAAAAASWAGRLSLSTAGRVLDAVPPCSPGVPSSSRTATSRRSTF